MCGPILLRRSTLCKGFLPEAAAESRPAGKQRNNCRAKKEPGWEMRFHKVHGA